MKQVAKAEAEMDLHSLITGAQQIAETQAGALQKTKPHRLDFAPLTQALLMSSGGDWQAHDADLTASIVLPAHSKKERA